MAWTTENKAQTIASIDAGMTQGKAFAERTAAKLAAGTQSSVILDVYLRATDEGKRLAGAALIDGIAELIVAEKGADALATVGAMLEKVEEIKVWIVANFPTDADGYLSARSITDDGIAERQFSAAEVGGLKTLLEELAALVV